MGYLSSCNAESAIATCDPYNWDRRSTDKTLHRRTIRHFTHSELAAATAGFSSSCFLGKGSHGSVYRAVLDDGKLVAAVKRTTLKSNSATVHRNCPNCTGCTSPADNEIEILSRVYSRRLVNLIGFSDNDDGDLEHHHHRHRLIVVEFMPNGSLYELLHRSDRPPGWRRRVRLALQVAKAVHALHSANPPVIHRDIKSSNVLIDEDRGARLGDFGLALRGHVEDVRVKCTPPAGTLGYLDPGYLAPGDLSTKSDVFSFGILLLEIISGRNAIDVNYSPPSVVDWAVPLIKSGEFDEICDRRLGPPPDLAVARQMAVLAARCVRSTAEKRPAMQEIVESLKASLKRAHSPPIWNHLRRRVTCAENHALPPPQQHQLTVKYELLDCTEEVGVKNSRNGHRRNRKVSSISGGSATVGSESRAGNLNPNPVMRSKSTGSFAENRKPVTDSGARRKGAQLHGVAVKMPAVKLSKSRSMGVLQNNNNNNNGVVFEIGLGKKRSNSTGIALISTNQFDGSNSKLVITAMDDKELLEKPLVSLHQI